MLGLLGTVVGMIGAFFKMASTGGQVDAAALANEIGGAMVTTASGLIIAIPMLFAFFFLRSINRSALELVAVCRSSRLLPPRQIKHANLMEGMAFTPYLPHVPLTARPLANEGGPSIRGLDSYG